LHSGPWNPDDWVTVAQVIRPWGNRGEVAAISLTSLANRFDTLREVYLFGENGPLGEEQPRHIESVWENRGRLIFKFLGIDTITDAEQLRGAEMKIPLAERPELPAGEYYHSDLAGCEVIDRNGSRIGRVRNWLDEGGSGVLSVEPAGNGEDVLIPFATSICIEIDVKARRIVVDLPEGLLEINRR